MDDARFDEILERWLDGESTPAEAAELEAALRADAGRRKRLVDRSLQEAQLREAFAGVLARPEPRRANRAAFRRRAQGADGRPWVAALVAAAALFGVVVLFASRPSPPAKPAEVARKPLPALLPAPAPEPDAPPSPKAEPPKPVVPPAPVPTPELPKPMTPEERERIEREMKAAIEATRPREAPPPQPPPAPKPTITGTVPEPARPVIATLAELDGEVALADGSPAKPGAPLRSGDGLLTSGGGRAVVKYPDGTRLELGSSTNLRDGEGGVVLGTGTVRADVAKQAQGKPFVVRTPHAEATVLGTVLTLTVADATRLEVAEGRVRLRRLSDGAAVEVVAGHFAVASPAAELAAKPIAGEIFRISFGPKDGGVPEGFEVDDGSPFDAGRGWGWSRDVRSFARLRSSGKDLLLRRSVTAGSSTARDRWEIVVPNGRYVVGFACGDSEFAQGPHEVVAEGVPVIRDAMNDKGKHLIVRNVVVNVQDGRFTLEVGALGSSKKASDGSSDTSIHYVVLQRLK